MAAKLEVLCRKSKRIFGNITENVYIWGYKKRKSSFSLVFLTTRMSKVCQITGKTVQYGNNVSHANNKTRRRFLPNLQKKRVWVPEEGKFVTLKISTRAMRTLDKKGYTAVVKEAKAKGLMA